MKMRKARQLVLTCIVLPSLSACQLTTVVKSERPVASAISVERPASRADLSAQDIEIIQKAVRELIDPSGKDFTKPPSIVVGVVKGNRSGAVGLGSTIIGRADSRPDENTLYAVGSITKLFTGVILAREVVERRLSASSRAAPLLPAEIRGFFDSNITLEDLVTHHSGLKSMPSNLDPVTGADGYSLTQLTDCFRSGGCDFNESGNYQYSNLGIAMLSLALENRFGFKNYDQLLRSKFTHALGLKNTATKDSDQYAKLNPQTAPASVAFGYIQGPQILTRPSHPQMGQIWDQKVAESKQRQPFSGMGILAGAGGALTNARDMIRLLKVLTGLERSVMTPAVELASRPLRRGSAIEGSQTNQREIGYAIDEFDMKQYRGVAACSQNLQSVIVKAKAGSTRSHTANIAWIPEKGLGLVIMVNRAGFGSKINCLSLNLLSQLMESR